MSDITLEVGVQQIWGDHAGDYGPDVTVGDLEVAGFTARQLTLNGVVDTAAREGAKADFGVNRGLWWSFMTTIETGVAVTGEPIDIYIGWSPVSTAGTGNPGNLTGADAAYTGGTPELAEGLALLKYLGSMICSNDQLPQTAHIKTLQTPERYGTIVVVNNSGATFHTDDVNMMVVATPIIGDVA